MPLGWSKFPEIYLKIEKPHETAWPKAIDSGRNMKDDSKDNLCYSVDLIFHKFILKLKVLENHIY